MSVLKLDRTLIDGGGKIPWQVKVAERLGISTKSLYTWKGQFVKPASVREAEADLAAELRRVKKELARVTEERDILKKAAAYFARESPLSRFACKPLPGSG